MRGGCAGRLNPQATFMPRLVILSAEPVDVSHWTKTWQFEAPQLAGGAALHKTTQDFLVAGPDGAKDRNLFGCVG